MKRPRPSVRAAARPLPEPPQVAEAPPPAEVNEDGTPWIGIEYRAT